MFEASISDLRDGSWDTSKTVEKKFVAPKSVENPFSHNFGKIGQMLIDSRENYEEILSSNLRHGSKTNPEIEMSEFIKKLERELNIKVNNDQFVELKDFFN